MIFKKKYFFILVILFFFCFKSFGQENKNLRVCVSGGFFPFESKNSEGKWIGFDINIMQDFSDKIHAQLQIVDIRWDGIIPALLSRKCDFIAGGMSITPERKKVIIFTDSIMKNSIAILAHKLDLPHEESLQDLDNNKNILAVRTGTSAATYLTKYPLKHLTILKFDDNPTLIDALITHKVNAIVQDKTLLIPFMKIHNDKFKILKIPVLEEDIALGARKENFVLVLKFNQFLNEWKKSGAYEKNRKEYFD